MPLLFLAMAAAVRGQSALDGFDPNANGPVRTVVVQPDGKILLGGEFTALAPNGGPSVARAYMARLNPDGTIDTAFNPNPTAPVYAITVQPDGKILVGGAFDGPNGIGGQPRDNIARLDPVTGLADSFNPDGSGFVDSIAVQADGKVLVGGLFSSIGGQPRNNIARLDPTTGLADSWDPNANGFVRSLALQPDGKILVGGRFNGANSIGGQARTGMARLDPVTGLADSFDPNTTGNPIGSVVSIVMQADGKIVVGGDFLSIGGQPRNFIARLDPTTGLADSFNPNSNHFIYSLALQPDGKILAGGIFTSMGGQARNRIARLDPTTGLADSLNPDAGSFFIFSLVLQADGKILAGGDFTNVGGCTRNRIARLEADGRLDQTLDLGLHPASIVYAIAVEPDGKILIGGWFSAVLGVPRKNMARLNSDGTLDTAFDPHAISFVYSIAVQPDGKILVGGQFSGPNSIGGQTRNHLARLDAVTGLADSFDPNISGFPINGVLAIAVQADGKIVAAGDFDGDNTIGGQTRNFIARLDAATGLADSFNPNPNTWVDSIAVQADGKILAGGGFTTIGGQMRNRLARLDAVAGLADSFDPGANSYVDSIAVHADGKVLAGGGFSGANSIGGQTRNRMARVDATTGLADSFDPNANDYVDAIVVQADGKVLASGRFRGPNSIGGQTRNYIARVDATTGLADSFDPNSSLQVYSIAIQADGKILAGSGSSANQPVIIGGQTRYVLARLSNGTAALQNLAVTQSTITWTHGGSSPQFTRVTFEYSTDRVNYTSLGNGMPAGSSWTLTGLSLPAGQNIYIRARGHYRTGSRNASESITESVRNVFLDGPAPTPTPSATPPATATPTAPATATPTATATSIPTATVAATPTPTPTPPSGCSAPSFAAAANFGTGDQPLTVATGDFNGDGKLDLAVANSGSNNVSVLLGNGTGGFAAAVNFGVGAAPFSVTTGDFNADGKLDLAAANRNSSNVSVLLGDGMGGFAAAVNFSTGLDPVSVTTGDFNGDGKLDLATANNSSANVSVLPGNGMGGFAAAVNFSAGGSPNSVTTGDFNADGKVDLATANPLSDNVSVLLGNGAGGFAAAVNFGAGDAPVSVTTGDFNADGKLDLVTANGIPNHVSVLLGNGTGGFAAPVTFAVIDGPGSVTTGDFNADGKLDLATANQNSDNVSVLLGDGMGGFAAAVNFGAGDGAVRITTGDFNADGRLDLAATNLNSDNVSVLLNLCVAPPAPTPSPSPTPTPTSTIAPTSTPSPSPTATATATATATTTPTATAIVTATATVVPTSTPTSTPMPTTSPTATPSPTPVAQAINLSTRMRVQTGDSVGIGGFIVTGTASKHVVLRAIGPSLAQLGVPDVLADPVLELHGPSGFVTIVNDNWKDDQEVTIAATGLAPTNDFEAAIDATLAPGAYTAIVRGNANTSGVALVEVYGLNQSASAKLANISTRALVGTGSNVVIAGFILGGGPPQADDDRLVVRGIGPSLAALGVANALADPQLELRDSDGALLNSNDDWQDDLTQAAELTAAGLAPANSFESGLAVTLPPGLYTALLSGVNNSAGVSLIEVYDRGAP